MAVTIIASTMLCVTACSQSPTPDATSTVATASSSDVTGSLTSAIQGIDAAIYGYGIVGAHLTGSEQKKVLRAMAALTRQRLAFMLAVGSQVNASAVAYELPFAVTDQVSAKKLGAQLEVRLIPLFNAVIADTTGPVNIAARLAKTKATARAAFWAGTSNNPAPNASTSGVTP